MKKIILVLSISTIVLFSSCSKSDDDQAVAPQTGVNQSLITGWWYRGLNAPIYKAYYFGADSSYKQDGGNFGLGVGLGTWVWVTSTKIKMTPIPGGGIAGSEVYLELSKLTQDSLVGSSPEIRLSRTNHN